MTELTEALGSGGFIVSEANGARSREQVTLVTGQVVEAGTVLGKITASGKYAVYDNAAVDGTQAAAAIALSACDATSADQDLVVILRDAEVNSDELDWGASDGTAITAGTADLLALGIILR